MVYARSMSANGGRSQWPRILGLPSSARARLYDGLRASPSGLTALALGTGLAAGVGAVIFRYLIGGFTVLFTGTLDYSGVGPAPYLVFGPWFVVAVPVLGGLLYGPLIDRFAREARGHGVPEVMLAVSREGGRIRPRVAVVKSLASAICIGSGGSVGREGPIVQIGSAVGSALGQAIKLSEGNLRLLVACGAAGGISATFNAPIAGVFFSLELILRDYEVRSFGVVVLASVVADIVSRAAFGNTSFLPLPEFQISSVWDYPLYALLGLLAAGIGLLFIRCLYGADDVANRVWGSRPEWLRPVAGGLLLGLLLLALPQLYGVGYPPLEAAIHGAFAFELVVLLLGAKILATSLTIAIGGSGGVFAPSMFIGGMLGMAYGMVVGQLGSDLVGPPGAYGLVGMGAVFAAAARAPITSVLIIFELTGDYRIILPLMLAVALAAGVSSVVTEDTIYTLKLRRRGVDVRRGRPANLMEILTVREAMRSIPIAVPADAAIGEFVERFVGDGRDAIPVVDEQGAYRGVVTAHQVEDSMRENSLGSTAGSLAQHLPALAPDATLEQAIETLTHVEASGLPVVDRPGARVVGWLTHRDILRTYAARIGAEVAVAERGKPATPAAGGSPAVTQPGPPSGIAGRLRDYRIVDLQVQDGSSLAGRRMADLQWPAFCLPIAVRRGDRSFRPGTETQIEAGDRITILAPQDVVEQVDASLTELVAAPAPPITPEVPGGLVASAAGEAPPEQPSAAEATGELASGAPATPAAVETADGRQRGERD
jgi:CIC family chloride channel protein